MKEQEKFNTFIKNFLQTNPIDKIAVALSGGVDSTALTLMMNNFCCENNIKLIAVIINHNWRKESASESIAVKNEFKGKGINCEILNYTGDLPTSNLEEFSRNFRYEMLINYCKDNGITTIATGHNKNESAETFYLNLIRGSGLFGLSSIPSITEKSGITFIRPLLDYTKEELQQYCKSQNMHWHEDPTNQDEKYDRIKIRKLQDTFENLGLTADRLQNTIKNLSSARNAIEFYTNNTVKNCITAYYDKLEMLEFDINKLLNNPDEIIYRAIQKLLSMISDKGENLKVRSETITTLIDNLKNTLKNNSFKDLIIADVNIKYIKPVKGENNSGKIQIIKVK